MTSFNFPEMLHTARSSLLEDSEAIRNNLLLGLSTEPGSLFGDPYWGCRLRRFIFEQPSTPIRDLIIDAIYTYILEFVPQIHIERKNIIVNTVSNELQVSLSYIIKSTGVSDMYSIKLADVDSF